MCGIWASLGLNPPKSVIEAVAHRGPDGEGWQEFTTKHGPLVLAHRRLAVIDTTDAGLQPMAYADQRYWIVYNGEIYNYIELREKLSTLGHRFISRSDTEVLLAAYAEWGEQCLDRLNGMFAFVIWDTLSRRLFIARDRFGIKPLYWFSDDRGIAFASEIKQFLHIPGFVPRLNHLRAFDFLAFGIRDHNSETLFRGVQQLGPGERMILDLDRWRPENIPNTERWYKRPVPGSIDMSADEAAETVFELLEDSVRLRLRSDVPIGFCLSGGLDSSSIVCNAVRQRPPHSFVSVSACFDDPEIDERRYIEAVTAATDVRTVNVFPTGEELVSELDRFTYHHDVPVTSTSMFAQWQVFKAARQASLKVTLNGQGADEYLCGYHSSFTPFLTELTRSFRLRRLLKETKAQRRRHGVSPWWQVAVIGAALLPEPMRQFVRHLRGSYRPDWLRLDQGPGASPLPRSDNLNGLILSHLFETSLPMLLHYEDRNSMAHGIESRLPFLDYRLVELVVGLGSQHKIVDGETKWILRQAMADVLPPLIRNRQDKIGFVTPERSWLLGPARKCVISGVEEALERFPGIFRHHALKRLRDDSLEGQRPFSPALWRIVSFATWGRVFKVEQ